MRGQSAQFNVVEQTIQPRPELRCLVLRVNNQAVQPRLVAVQHSVWNRNGQSLRGNIRLAFLSQDTHTVAVQLLSQPRVVNLQAVITLSNVSVA